MDTKTSGRVPKRAPLAVTANLSPSVITNGVKSIARNQAVTEELLQGLIDTGLARVKMNNRPILTTLGQDLDSVSNIFEDQSEAILIIRDAMVGLRVTEAILQGLKVKGVLTVSGCLHLLIRHSLATDDDETTFRKILANLSELGIIIYSRKNQTLRAVAGNAGPYKPKNILLIEPETPYSNVMALRQLIRESEDYIWWADPHFSRKGLEPLAEESGSQRVREIKILSGPAQINVKALNDFKRFQAEMLARGVSAEWRIVKSERNWHDRFFISANSAWNLPPINTLFKGDYSEIAKTNPPPFETWWSSGVDIADYMDA